MLANLTKYSKKSKQANATFYYTSPSTPPKMAYVNTIVNTFIWKLQTIHIFLQQTEKNRK